ncbi:hypothetical protein HYE67_009067 [Fusarium culmorum]|uniref:Uncharacterized protein n=1 Tax=Fusarium culmorum TaxID=5516 RepID=A0A2T4HA01_FUSCU|nr:hypothetical protein FCULG_00003781 [Fusarium culmorum]QPC66836.1 hypothetical protein HYE67_009067 [Fusarium culmorum]
MGKQAKQAKQSNQANTVNQADTASHANTASPADTAKHGDHAERESWHAANLKAKMFVEFFRGLRREHLTADISQSSKYCRETLYRRLLTFDTSHYPPPLHTTSLSLEFRYLADSMLRYAHALGTDDEWIAFMDFTTAFRTQYNSASYDMKTDCIPLDMSICITRLYALVTSDHTITGNAEKDDHIGLDFLILMAARMEPTFDHNGSDCEQYWTLKFIETARRAAKGATYEANISMKLYLYFLVSRLPQVLQRF